jgi:colanic acid biosynthesis glycosyl transferase WcaI
LRLAVLCPHFEPDTAPTGDVMTRIVHELAARGHELHVVTSLPWYRTHAIEPGWEGRWIRRETTPWGSITRVNPFPGGDKTNLVRRALGFVGFSALTGITSWRGGRVDAVIAMSPPLTMGLTGWTTHLVRRGSLVFNIQDVFPDAAVRTGAITNRHVIRVASRLERVSYHRAAAVTVLSEDLRVNVAGKMSAGRSDRVHVIPNFVDVEAIRPGERTAPLRAELGIGDEPLVVYSGNVGFSQSLELMFAAARELPDATFLISGDGSAKAALVAQAAAEPGLTNVRFSGYQPKERLSELLGIADVHVVPLRAGLGNVSVPSKTYSILASGRPILASIDAGTEVPRILEASGAGVAVAPDRPDLFVAALRELLADPVTLAARGAAGRTWVEAAASPAAVARAYEELVHGLPGCRDIRSDGG